jgi:bacteriocin biosynthesis cyclodehydratase domain-containing protein
VRLQIKPGLPVAWRSADSVQIGLDPERGTVLEGLTPPDCDLVEHLTSSLDEAALPDPGPQAERARWLLRLLADSDVLVSTRAGRGVLGQVAQDAPRLAPDAQVWGVAYPDAGDGWELVAGRRQRCVEVRGAGRLGIALVTCLAAAGVGTVRLLDGRRVRVQDVGPAAASWRDVGSRPCEAARRAVDRLRPAAKGPPVGPDGPADEAPPADLVVLVRSTVADSLEAVPLLADAVPHLSVVVRERGLVVGPLVVPGKVACLRCLDLHRTERDPAWPRVLAQLAGPRAARAAEESASALLGASLAALQVLAHLDGRVRPAALGATLEVELPDGLTSRRPWPPHPSCGCFWADGGGASERSEAGEARMSG